MQEFNNRLNRFGEWVIRLVSLNFLWIGFTVLGLGVFGIFPATSAMFSMIRKWLVGNEDIKIASGFIEFYKKDFMKSNLLGYIFVIFAIIIWIDYRWISSNVSLGMFALGYFMLIVLVFALLSFIVLFPIYSHYQLSIIQYMKNAIFFPLANVLTMVVLGAALFMIQLLFSQIPGILLFVGVSFPAYVTMKIILPVFQGKPLSINGFFKIFRKSNEERMYY
ncbi:YesL family protein [Ureibacillus manganicus]|uniref:YesL family protein n=1 Tax=Ureibacillus manganicus TaxID=1266064 RepID=UPI00068F716F|nr:DUF624 domain-containing protein [Ureibacillus manganicus]